MKRSVQGDLAALRVLDRHIDAFLVDWPQLLARLDDWRSGYGTGGDGSPTGKGGHRDLSDRLNYGPDGNPLGDPVDRVAVELGQFLQMMMRGATGARALIERHLTDPTPTNLCRGGQCPAGNMASPGKAGRCSACSAFWYQTGDSPHDGSRYERSEPGERPVNRSRLNRETAA